MSVPGFAELPDEERSREAELPARPRCKPRSLSHARARARESVLAGVRCRAQGPDGSVLKRSRRSEAAVQPGLAKVCRLREAEALR